MPVEELFSSVGRITSLQRLHRSKPLHQVQGDVQIQIGAGDRSELVASLLWSAAHYDILYRLTSHVMQLKDAKDRK